MKKTKVEGDEIELYKKHGIDGFIAKGTYNCAHLVTIDGEQWVMRVGIVTFEKNGTPTYELNGVLRGLDVLDLLNKEPILYGPSLLKERKHYVIDPKDFTLANNPNLCDKLKKKIKSPYIVKYAIQYIEYLRGTFLQNIKNDSEMIRALFCMIWFLRGAQKRFGFSHRDLKANNLLVRLYEKPVLLKFIYNKTNRFIFETSAIPVFIDFDFASSFNTTRKENILNGTWYTTPPEATFYVFHPTILQYTSNDYLAYDYWSIGVCCLETIYFNKTGKYISALCYDVINKIHGFIPSEEKYKIVFNMLMTYTMIHKSPMEFMPKYFIRYYKQLIEVFDDCIKTEEYQLFDEVIDTLEQKTHYLVADLLSWDTKDRLAVNLYNPCFKTFTTSNEIKNENVYTYVMDEEALEKMSSTDVKRDYKYIESQNGCLTCDKKGAHLQACVCCAALYCGKECQRQVH